MSVTLYRKYRPQTFEEIVNQDHVKVTLQQEIINKKLPHAFLFYGPRGIGKTTSARVLAKALNCLERKDDQAEPCNQCKVCEAITKGASLNLVEVDAASQTGVDNVRDNIIANARVAVNSGGYKVFIIDEVHMLSASSFNALLKTLEEPPERVIFVLATTEIHKIPETIISRCQRFDFHPVSSNILKEHLKKIASKEDRDVDDQVLNAIVKKSAGHVRDAISLLGQTFSMPGKITVETTSFVLPVSNIEHIVTFFNHVSKKKAADAMLFLDYLEQQGVRPYHFCRDLIEFAHKMMLLRIGSHLKIFDGEAGKETMEEIQTIVKRYSADQLLKTIDILIKRSIQLKDLDQGRLPLELAVVELIGSQELGTRDEKSGAEDQQFKNDRKDFASQRLNKDNQPSKQESAKQKNVSGLNKKFDPVIDGNLPVIEYDDDDDLPQASFEEVKSIWSQVMEGLSADYHSLFIVLRTADFREGKDGRPELAFRFQMHHDHVKQCLSKIIEQARKIIPEKSIKFVLSVDSDIISEVGGDVEEPKNDEKEAISADLSKLAEAFGGNLMD